MARLETNGLDALIIDLDTITVIPEKTISNMLMAGGEIIARGHKEELDSLGLSNTGKLKANVTIHQKRSGQYPSKRYVLIYPYGTHHTYNARTKTYTKYNWGKKGKTKAKGGGTGIATNNDVGFVHEFGGHGNKATQWMRIANEKHAAEAVDAESKVYDEWLKLKKL